MNEQPILTGFAQAQLRKEAGASTRLDGETYALEEDVPLPYPEPGGEMTTGGHSGTDTSRDRATSEAKDGTAQKRLREVLSIADVYASYGVTVADLRDSTGLHHGQASSALSNLHKMGKMVRLVEKRDRCHIYVLPEFAGDRETQPFGRKRPAALPQHQEEALRRLRGLLDSRAKGDWMLFPTSYVEAVVEALEARHG